MPLNPSTLATVFLTPNLRGMGHLGTGVPKFAKGVATGVVLFLQAATVNTIDVGTAGVGASIFPLIVPPQLIQVGLTAGFTSQGILGIFAPLTIVGLGNGLAQGFLATALLQATHPGVGLGTGVARINAPPATPFMIAGFSSEGMTNSGSIKIATAIGTALDTTFSVFFTPIPIVGPPNIVPGGGSGFGKVI